MKFLASFILIGLLAAVYAADQCKPKIDYDNYILTLSWPSTFCSQNQCKPAIKKGETKFTVHGLWPNRNDRGQVGYCCGEDYNRAASQLQPFKSKLSAYWPSMRDDNVDGFWRYEWKKHGTCAKDSPELNGVKKYFETSLKLVEKLDLDNTMKKIDFAPSDDVTVTKDSRKLADALKKAYNVKPKIRCVVVNPQTAVLEQVQFCYDKSLKMIDCEGPLQCKKNVIIPTYKADFSKLKMTR